MKLLNFTIDEINHLDIILQYYYDKNEIQKAANTFSIINDLSNDILEVEIYNHIETLCYHEYIDKLTSHSGGASENLYRINPKGRAMIDSGGFEEEYKIQVQEDNLKETQKLKDERKSELEIMQLEANINLAKSVLETNISIINVNQKTEQNYKIQTKLTYAIFVAAAVSAIAALTPFFDNASKRTADKSIQDTLQTMQKKVSQLEQTLQSRLKIDSSFQESVKDSLGMSK